MKQSIWFGIVAAAASGACSSGGGGGLGAGGKKLPAEVTAWMPKDAAKAWEGTWSTRLSLEMAGRISSAGTPAALEIKGNKATAFDGTKDHELGFAIASPCAVDFTRKTKLAGMEGTETISKQFVVKDGTVLIGDGSVGYRKGKTALVCASSSMDGFYVVTEKGCTQWKQKFFNLEAVPADCPWTSEDGKDVLTIGTGDWKTKLIADGDTLQSSQFTDMIKHTTKTATFAEAKAKVTELAKEK